MWAWLSHRHLGYQDVGLSHDLVIHNRQFWRIVTSQLSHVDFIHLLFNMTSLWSLGGFEQGGQNSIVVLQQSLWLLVGSGLVSEFVKQNKKPLHNAGTFLTDLFSDVCLSRCAYFVLIRAGLMQICLAIYHAAIHLFHKEHYRHVTAVGYSAVIFGWMALLSAREMLLSLTSCFPLQQHHCITCTSPTPAYACTCTTGCL